MNSTTWLSRFSTRALLVLLAALPSARAIELHVEKTSPYDLALTGLFKGVPPGETRYVHWADLRTLPVTKLKLSGEFVSGEQEVTALDLKTLLKSLPLEANADTLLATCADGYASVYRQEFIETYQPFVVLEINGQGPDHWPPPGLKYNPGPYVITVSAQRVPAVSTYLDINHKRPWAVTLIEAANYEKRFASLYSGNGARLSPQAVQGREIWINSCFSCHQGPGAQPLGGTKANRPFPVLVAHATYNADYFKGYVRDPKKMMSGAKMEAHPHYTEAQLDALIAFLKSGLN